MADLHHRAEALAQSLPPLMVAAERVAATVQLGVHGRRRSGPGEAFWQFRPYQSGDEPRRVDWRRTARSERVFVRETEWSAALGVWLWRDGSASMDWRSDPDLPTKRERADLLLAALAALLARGGERIGVLGSGSPLSGGRMAARRAAEMLATNAGGNDGLPRPAPVAAHSRLMLAGDFLAPLDEVEASLSAFAASGLSGHAVQVLDPAEETPPFAGRVRFEGLEGEDPVLVPRAEDVREDHAAAMARHREGLRALVRAKGWTFDVHHTDRGPETALLNMFQALSEGWEARTC